MTLGFKPQPLNYSAQAEAALRKLAPRVVANGAPDEARIMIWLADQIRDAVHFVMPEDGRIFDDKFKGIQGSEAHLPFPRITLEYFANRDPGISTEGKPLHKATRRVLLAMELTAEGLVDLIRTMFLKGIQIPAALNKLLTMYPDGVILVTGAFFIDYEAPMWVPSYAAWLLPVEGWACANGIMGKPLPVMWDVWKNMTDKFGWDKTTEDAKLDIGAEAFVVLELIEALSCRNVRVGTLQYVKPNVNARRIRDGKLPLYETKILTIDISPKKPGMARGPLDADRASPGEHLRMGHIQTYHTKQGPVNLWKQMQLVSVGNPRVIKKSYRLKKGV